MPLIELTFDSIFVGNDTSQLPSMLQVGDTAYYVPGTNINAYDANGVGLNGSHIQYTSNVTEQQVLVTIGLVTDILVNESTTNAIGVTTEGGFTVICDISQDTTPPTTTDFILFSKDNEVNLSTLKGYFGKTKLINNSTEKAELYAISCEIAESSK